MTVSESDAGDGVRVLTIDDPGIRNAMSLTTWRAIGSALTGIEEDPAAKVVVLGSAGPTFSAGGDLRTGPAHGFRAVRDAGRLKVAHQVIAQIKGFPLPVIAAVQGAAVGVGWSLVLAADFAVAEESAVFIAPFIQRGIVPDGGLAWFLTQSVGRQATLELLLSGRRLSAQEALERGLVARVVAAGAREEAIRLGRGLAGSPDAMELTKSLVNAAASSSFTEYLSTELTTAALAQSGPDAEAGRIAFFSKSAPRWRTNINQTDAVESLRD